MAKDRWKKLVFDEENRVKRKNIIIVHSKNMILDNHNLSVDTNAGRCKTLIWCPRTDQRRRRRCLAPKRSSCSDTGCSSQPLPSKHRCVRRSKYFFSCYWAFSGFGGCYFSGWGSPVDSFLVSETSTFTIDNGDQARKGRTTEPWRSPPNRQRRSAIVIFF